MRQRPGERGPYAYAYLVHNGSLSNLPDTQRKVWQALSEQGITPGKSINVLFDDPRKVAGSKLRAHTGYLIQAGDTHSRRPHIYATPICA